MPLLDLKRLRAAPLRRDPFDFIIVDDFVQTEHLPALIADFPAVRRHGSFPLGALSPGATFGRLAGGALRAVFRQHLQGAGGARQRPHAHQRGDSIERVGRVGHRLERRSAVVAAEAGEFGIAW